MHGIDPPTLIIVASFLTLLLTLVLASMRTSFPSSGDSIGLWAIAMPMFVAASLTFSQQQTHPFVHVMLANTFFLAGTLLMNLSLLRFYGLKSPRLPWVVAMAGAGILAALAWWLFVQPSFILRLVMMSAVGALLFGHLCWLSLHHGGRSLGSLIASLAFGLTTASCLLRMLSAAGNFDHPTQLLDLSAIQTIYLSSFHVSLLIGTVGFILQVNERLRKTLEFNASHDALTGVLNRGAFFQMAHAEFEEHRRQGQPLSVALLDLDDFKQINDQYGHAVGDRVLQDFCKAVGAELDPDDILGRYGGEEFVILLPGTKREDASARARYFHSRLKPTTGLPTYTVSIGLATLEPETTSIDELLIAADNALYQAKRNGRNRVEEWDPQREAAQKALSWRRFALR